MASGESASRPSLEVAIRSVGVTPEERYLQRLCDRSFLSLWSYPSVFRSQKANQKGDGKELCDLLVVCGNDVLIFSDKSCKFPNTGDVRLDWCRWFREAIFKSAQQAWGAERWLLEFPDRIFLDRACTQQFPIELPRRDAVRLHHIVVAHTVGARCSAYFPGSSSTLTFDSSITGRDHFADSNMVRPFEVGWLDPKRRFVHVLDDESLEILLGHRDTIMDFVKYLQWKEELLHSAKEKNVRVIHCGEEDLLANYLSTTKNGGNGFSLPAEPMACFYIDEGDWTLFKRSKEYDALWEANKTSYFWDELIEKFNKNILAGTSYDRATTRIADREKSVRLLARVPRLQRRLLAKAFLSFLDQTKVDFRATRVILPERAEDPYFCLLLLPRIFGISDEKYRQAGGQHLEALCRITKLIYPDALDIVGIATETDIERTVRSEDVMYLDARGWNEADQEYARELQELFGLLTNVTKVYAKDVEFPVPVGTEQRASRLNFALGKNPRNKPCQCGSGKKFKKCHGAN